MKIVITLLLFIIPSMLFGIQPDWINHLPFTEDAFWGVGYGESSEEAEMEARKEILMQMSSHVSSIITLEDSNLSQTQKISETMEIFFKENKLRGAELVETYSVDQKHYALVKYCDTCGDIIMNTAIKRFEQELEYDANKIIDKLSDDKVNTALLLQRRLQSLKLDDYGSKDIFISIKEKSIIISIVNFLSNNSELTSSQRKGLEILSHTLFKELETLNYSTITVVGHANPTGLKNEFDELETLSKNRAETMTVFLRNAGLEIDSTEWRGGNDTIGDIDSPSGKGLNRRVELIVGFDV